MPPPPAAPAPGPRPVDRPDDRSTGPTAARPGRLRLATRGSPLALRQVGLVEAALAVAHPGLVLERVVVSTAGDRSGEPLDRIGGQGVFVKEVEAALIDGRADVAVHSAKDLPSDSPTGLVLAAVPERGDPRDALVGSRLADLAPGATVATGSARRRAQLANLRPDLTFADLRGNMDRRVRRGEDGSVGAVVVAVAALARLGWAGRITEVLGTEVLLPQAGQGAVALQCRAGDGATAALLAPVDHAASHRALVAERAVLAGVGGSCTVPVGAYARTGPDGSLELTGLMASGDGRILIRHRRAGDDPGKLGAAVARFLLGEGGGSGLEGFGP